MQDVYFHQCVFLRTKPTSNFEKDHLIKKNSSLLNFIVVDFDSANFDKHTSVAIKDVKTAQHAMLFYIDKFGDYFEHSQYYFITHDIKIPDIDIEFVPPFAYIEDTDYTVHDINHVNVEYLSHLDMPLPKLWKSKQSCFITANSKTLTSKLPKMRKMLSLLEKYPESHDFVLSLWGVILDEEKHLADFTDV